MKKIVYWVKFYSPGAFFAEHWNKEYESEPNPKSVEWPDSAYCFSIYKRTDIIESADIFTGKAEQIGPVYYHPDSKIETYAQAATNPNCTGVLLSNMRNNKWRSIIWSRWGNWPQPFDPEKEKILKA